MWLDDAGPQLLQTDASSARVRLPPGVRARHDERNPQIAGSAYCNHPFADG